MQWIPSTQGFVDAALAGLGWGMTPMAVKPMPTGRPSKHESLPPRRTATLHADQIFAVVRLDDGRLAAPTVALDTGADASSGGYGSRETPATPATAIFAADWTGVKSPDAQRIFGSSCLLPRAAALDASRRTGAPAPAATPTVATTG